MTNPPRPWSVVLFLAVEAGLLVVFRDSLTLNVLMLVHPIEAIRTWQSPVDGRPGLRYTGNNLPTKGTTMRPPFARTKPVLLFLAAMTSWLGAGHPAAADVTRYVFPENLALSMTPLGSWSPERGGGVKAQITSRLGTLRQLEIFFETSPDLTVHPLVGRVAELAEGASEILPLRVGKGPGMPDQMGSWIRMRVRYLPDYERITQAVRDPAAYPNPSERQRLLDIVDRNARRAERYTAAFRFFAR